ncbi:universal stress protein [filamentous cyanobacterium CCP2]|nr:universal stress protein [filamentous cyanobacterium CCP2]
MFQKILVAVDGSAISDTAFEEALHLARANQSAMMLVHVLSGDTQGNLIPPSMLIHYYPIVSDELTQRYQEQWEAATEQGITMLQDYAQRAALAGVETEFTQNIGTPGQVICTIAEDWGADLIVMGRRGYSGFSELLMGSVSNYVVHHAHCSVLAIQGKKLTEENAQTSVQARIWQ